MKIITLIIKQGGVLLTLCFGMRNYYEKSFKLLSDAKLHAQYLNFYYTGPQFLLFSL